METFNFDKAKEYYDYAKTGIDKDIWVTIYSIMIENKLPFDLPTKKEARQQPYEYTFFTDILVSTYYLCNGDIIKAKEHLPALDSTMWRNLSSNYMSYAAIRIELCNKKAEAAMQLMKKKTNSAKHTLDDFFFYRIEKLRGNHTLADQYFRSAYKECEKYSALNRLYHEIDISYELKKSTLFHLGNDFNLEPTKKINIQEIYPEPKKQKAQFIGISKEAEKVRAKIKSLANINVPILILGETGTGKEVVAKAIHDQSNRSDEPFLAINCGAIADSLLQSELFGHEAGSFTGAGKAHTGIFLAAKKGTIFLDEIGEISPSLQVSLLRVLENREIRPIGSSKQIPFHCQILAATNANLEQLSEIGKFRTDLIYRLRRMEISIPPLRKRKEDIIVLTKHFLNNNRDFDQDPKLAEELCQALTEFNWPGNARQLRNEIEKMDLLNSRKSYYELSDCPLFDNTDDSNNDSTPPTQSIQPTTSEKPSQRNRLKELKELFSIRKELSRNEVSKQLKISLPTATNDLKTLLAENFIEKIEPSASPRSHYFILKKN